MAFLPTMGGNEQKYVNEAFDANWGSSFKTQRKRF